MDNKRSRNYFINANTFISFATWKNNEEMFSLFPGVFIKRNIDKGLEIQENRYVIFLGGRRRFEITTGKYTPRNKILNWKSSGLEDFILWIRKNVNDSFNKYDMEIFLNNSPQWKKIITQSNCNNHYIRILLARELADFSTGKKEETKPVVNENKSKNSFAKNALLSSLDKLEKEENNEVLNDNIDPLDRLGDALSIQEDGIQSWNPDKK